MTTGGVLAEAADDVVTAQSLPRQRIGRQATGGCGSGGGSGATISSWREWEIELVDGPTTVSSSSPATKSDVYPTESFGR